MRYLIIVATLWAATATAAENGIALLQQFLQATPSAKIAFRQTALDKGGRVVAKSRGRFWYQRPHLFRMEYEPPESIVMVSDGAQTWTYEPDIQQVLVQSAENLSGASVLLDMLASGKLDGLRANYILSAGLNEPWVIAEARTSDQAIRKMRLEFLPDGALQRVELTDSFDSNVRLEIHTVSRATLDKSLFTFNPPIGVDIVRE